MERQVFVGGGVALCGAVVVAMCGKALRKKEEGEKEEEVLSARGRALEQPALPYIKEVIKAFGSPFEASSNPEGYILLAVAENKLCWPDVIRPRLKRYLTFEREGELPDWVANYGALEGPQSLREALALVMKRKMLQADPFDPLPYEFDAESIVCTAGATAALSNLFFAICEPGDTVLIPAPYYAAFDNDLRAFADLRRESVALVDNRLSSAALEEAYQRVIEARGKPPRALLITNPHNPLGLVATEAELRDVVAWAHSKPNFDLVSDEIYALSCFAAEKRQLGGRVVSADTFVSIATVVDGRLAEHRVHVVWGLSKDFGISGFRLGVVWSGDKRVAAAMRAAALFSPVSGPTAALVTTLFTDYGWLNGYLDHNAQALATSCRCVENALDALHLPYVPPNAGMFILVDLSSLLPLLAGDQSDPWAREAYLFQDLIDKQHLIFTPGHAQHTTSPGWFRICFAYVSLDTLKIAMDRLSSYVTDLRQAAEPAALSTESAAESAPEGGGETPSC